MSETPPTPSTSKASDDPGAFGFLTPSQERVLKGAAFVLAARLVKTPRTADDWSYTLLLDVHRDLFRGVFTKQAGQRRFVEVGFRGHIIPTPGQIDYRLAQLVREAAAMVANAAELSVEERVATLIPRLAAFHAQCVITQPFIDGNKRWSRQVLNALLVDIGFYPGIALDEPERAEYLDGIDKAASGQPEQLATSILRSWAAQDAAYRHASRG